MANASLRKATAIQTAGSGAKPETYWAAALPDVMPIIGADDDKHYRNKLEFTFSNKRYLLPEEIGSAEEGLGSEGALGSCAPPV